MMKMTVKYHAVNPQCSSWRWRTWRRRVVAAVFTSHTHQPLCVGMLEILTSCSSSLFQTVFYLPALWMKTWSSPSPGVLRCCLTRATTVPYIHSREDTATHTLWSAFFYAPTSQIITLLLFCPAQGYRLWDRRSCGQKPAHLWSVLLLHLRQTGIIGAWWCSL